MGLADGCKWRLHSTVRTQSQATSASRPDDSRKRALPRASRPAASSLPQFRSQSRSWRGIRGRPSDKTILQAGRLKRLSVLAARKVPQSIGAAVLGSTDEPPSAPRPGHRQLSVIRKHRVTGYNQPLPHQRVADTVRAATEPLAQSRGESAEMSTLCKNEAASAHSCHDRGIQGSGAKAAVTKRRGIFLGP